jgi:hypothetical protein
MSSTQTLTEEQVKEKGADRTPELLEEGRTQKKKGAWSNKPAAEVVVSTPALATRSGAQAHKVRFLTEQNPDMTKKGKSKDKKKIYPDLSMEEARQEEIPVTQPEPTVTTVQSGNLSVHALQEHDVTMADIQADVRLTESEWPSMPKPQNPDAQSATFQQDTVNPATDTLYTLDATTATVQPSETQATNPDLVYDLAQYCPPEVVANEEQRLANLYRRYLSEGDALKTRIHRMAGEFRSRWMTPEETQEATLLFHRIKVCLTSIQRVSEKMSIIDRRKGITANVRDPRGDAQIYFDQRTSQINSVFDHNYLNSAARMVERHIPSDSTLASTSKKATWEKNDAEFMEAAKQKQQPEHVGGARPKELEDPCIKEKGPMTSTPQHVTPDSSFVLPQNTMSPIPEENKSTSTQADMPQQDVTFVNLNTPDKQIPNKFQTLDESKHVPLLSPMHGAYSRHRTPFVVPTSVSRRPPPPGQPMLRGFRPKGPAPPIPKLRGAAPFGNKGPRMATRTQEPLPKMVGAGGPPDDSSSSTEDSESSSGLYSNGDPTQDQYDTARQDVTARRHADTPSLPITRSGQQSAARQILAHPLLPEGLFFPDGVVPTIRERVFANTQATEQKPRFVSQSPDLVWDYQQYPQFPARPMASTQASRYLAEQRKLQQEEERRKREQETRYFENIINHQPNVGAGENVHSVGAPGGDEPHGRRGPGDDRQHNRNLGGNEQFGPSRFQDARQYGGSGFSHGGPSGGGPPGGGPPGGGPPGGGPPGGGPPGGGPPGDDPYRGNRGDSAAMRRLRELEEELARLRAERERDLAVPPPWVQQMMFQTQQQHRPLKHKLAPLKLMQFSGDHTQWPTFWDLFYALIHKEPNLTDVEKLAYLDSTLTENSDAKKAIAGFRKIGRSYDAIIMRLKTKYGQKSRLLATLIREILYTSPAENAGTAQAMIDKFWGDIRALESYGVPLKDPCTSIMLISVLQSKMPKKVSEQWELQLLQDATKKAEESQLEVTIPDEDACPPFSIDYTVGQFLTFCEERVRASLKTNELAAGNKNLLKDNKVQKTNVQTKTQTSQSAGTSKSNNQPSDNKAKPTGKGSQQAPTAQALVVGQTTGTSRNARRKARKKAAKDAADATNDSTQTQPKANDPEFVLHDTGCFLCGSGHNAASCPQRSKMYIKEKWKRIRERIKRTGIVCMRCFDEGDHKADSCPKGACGVNGCEKRHHPILHKDPENKDN